MHPKRVVIARVSVVVAAVVAIIIVVAAVVVAAAVGPSGVFSLGTSSQMYKSLSSLPVAAHELELGSSE
jgi:vancomycin permeability regulator SanA